MSHSKGNGRGSLNSTVELRMAERGDGLSTRSRTTCLACSTNFTSRTRLFRHLQETGHGTQAAASAAAAVDVDLHVHVDRPAVTASIDDVEPTVSTHLVRRTSESFERFYQLQALCSAPLHRRVRTTIRSTPNKEEEDAAWTAVLHRFDTALPIAARVSSSSAVGGLCHALVRAVSGDAGKSHILGNNDGDDVDDDDKSPKSRFIVFPKHGLDQRTGRLLAASQELGALIRQELCSALPPLLLMDLIQPTTTTTANNKNNTTTTHPTVLADMCAAPGSKTLQLLDLLYQQQQQQQTNKSAPSIIVPRSLVVANEISRSRLLDLNRRSRRLPRSHLLTICQDASHFPGIRRRTPAGGPCGYKQKYNGVLCDVPCSGDGTGRKAPKVCGTAWAVQEGLSLHYLQLKILLRGLQLLQPGGVCVYSTCSLNPIENEAVVKTVLERFGLVNIEVIELPVWFVEQVKPREGLERWVVPGSGFGKQQQATATGPNYSLVYDHFEDVPWEERHRSVQVASDMDHHGLEKVKRKGGKGMLVPTMFPPTDPQLIQHLKRCGRVMPSERFDSGGFFVAALRRKNSGELPMKQKTASHNQPPNPSKISPENDNNEDKDEDDVVPSMIPIDGTKKRPLINIDGDDLTSVETVAKDPTDKNGKDGNASHREGDWTCFLCQTNNFAFRGRCFHCRKGKKPRERKEKGKEMVPFEPLLQRFHPNVTNHEEGVSPSGEASSLIVSFCEYFGLCVDTESAIVAGVLRFPVESVCVLQRKQGRRVLVLASEALSDLAISRSWASVSEAGLYLADHMPERSNGNDGDDNKERTGIEEDSSLECWKLYDEVTFLLAKCATRRAIHLGADLLRHALVEAIANPPEGTTEIEKSRVVNTFGIPNKIKRNDDDDKNPWWQTEAFMELIAKGVGPGWVILVCDCSTISTTDHDNDPSAAVSGVLSFAAIMRQDGSIHIQSSHRVVAASLVVLEEYLSMNPIMDSLK